MSMILARCRMEQNVPPTVCVSTPSVSLYLNNLSHVTVMVEVSVTSSINAIVTSAGLLQTASAKGRGVLSPAILWLLMVQISH